MLDPTLLIDIPLHHKFSIKNVKLKIQDVQLKIKAMKKNVIFALIMLAAGFASGQKQNVTEIEVTAPRFTGIKNAIQVKNESSATLIKKYLSKNVEFPVEDAATKTEGTEVVQFTVTSTGYVTDFKIINSVSKDIDNEIIRVLKKTDGMWLPGYNNGKPVDMTKEVSLVFCLEKKNSESITDMFTKKAANFFSAGTVAFFEKKNPRKALKFYNCSANYLPSDNSLLLLRGVCRYELGDTEGAKEDWNRMASLGGTIDMSEYTGQIAGLKGYNELMTIITK